MEKAIRIAKERDCLLSFDVADPFVVRNNRDEFISLINNDCNIVFANREEAKILYNSNSSEEIVQKMAQRDSIAILKLDSDGALVCQNGEIEKIEAVSTQVVDTTGAGDIFAAGFLYGYRKKKSLQESGKIAATLASDVISRYGVEVRQSLLVEMQ